MGIDSIVEIGPKRVLSGLIKNICRGMQLHYVGNHESLQQFIDIHHTTSKTASATRHVGL